MQACVVTGYLCWWAYWYDVFGCWYKINKCCNVFRMVFWWKWRRDNVLWMTKESKLGMKWITVHWKIYLQVNQWSSPISIIFFSVSYWPLPAMFLQIWKTSRIGGRMEWGEVTAGELTISIPSSKCPQKCKSKLPLDYHVYLDLLFRTLRLLQCDFLITLRLSFDILWLFAETWQFLGALFSCGI